LAFFNKLPNRDRAGNGIEQPPNRRRSSKKERKKYAPRNPIFQKGNGGLDFFISQNRRLALAYAILA